MFSLIKRFLRFIFGASATTPAPEPRKLIPFEWPFPSSEPKNVEYLLGELARGTETQDGHTFYFWGGEKRRHLRTAKGTETILARHIVWWMFGRKQPKTASGLTTNCGEAKCIKLDHLILKPSNVVLGPENKPQRKVPEPKPRVVKEVKVDESDEWAKKYDAANRMKCISRKIYFETKEEGHRYNAHLRRKKSQSRARRNSARQYVYKCEIMDCPGWHLTHKDPKKAKKNKKQAGRW